jgi:hypothetical protein
VCDCADGAAGVGTADHDRQSRHGATSYSGQGPGAAVTRGESDHPGPVLLRGDTVEPRQARGGLPGRRWLTGGPARSAAPSRAGDRPRRCESRAALPGATVEGPAYPGGPLARGAPDRGLLRAPGARREGEGCPGSALTALGTVRRIGGHGGVAPRTAARWERPARGEPLGGVPAGDVAVPGPGTRTWATPVAPPRRRAVGSATVGVSPVVDGQRDLRIR